MSYSTDPYVVSAGPETTGIPLLPPDPGVREIAPKFLTPNSSVLDVGTGRGRNAIYLAELGHRVVAMDTNEEYLQQCAAHVETHEKMLDIRLEKADMRYLPYLPESFKAVFVTRSLQELNNKQESLQVIKNVKQVARPGGHNFITAYVGTPDQQAELPHITIYEPEEIEAVYQDEDWGILHRRQNIVPLAQHAGRTLINSYVEIVAQKPA